MRDQGLFARSDETAVCPDANSGSVARLIAHAQLLGPAELLYQSAHRLITIGDNPEAAYFPAHLSNRHRNRLRMDIQPYKSYVLHGRLPFVCGSAPRFFPDPQ